MVLVSGLQVAETLVWTLLINIAVHCSQRLTEVGAKGRWDVRWAPVVEVCRLLVSGSRV